VRLVRSFGLRFFVRAVFDPPPQLIVVGSMQEIKGNEGGASDATVRLFVFSFRPRPDGGHENGPYKAIKRYVANGHISGAQGQNIKAIGGHLRFDLFYFTRVENWRVWAVYHRRAHGRRRATTPGHDLESETQTCSPGWRAQRNGASCSRNGCGVAEAVARSLRAAREDAKKKRRAITQREHRGHQRGGRHPRTKERAEGTKTRPTLWPSASCPEGERGKERKQR
jgi:hypothetical protein